jgi:iron complex outermembrane receptor protein
MTAAMARLLLVLLSATQPPAGTEATPDASTRDASRRDASTSPATTASQAERATADVHVATKIGRPLRETPGAVDVVDRDEARTHGWTSLADVLYQQPGFAPAQDYDRRTVGARGLFEGWNNNHLLHLVDGVPWNDNLYGSAYTWEITPLAMARTVEVLRGPGSALYGSYAMNGVVQVNTVSAVDLGGVGMAEVRAGNQGTLAYDLLAGFGAGKPVSGVIGYSSSETDGNEYPSYDGSARLDSAPSSTPAADELARFDTRDRRSSRYLWAKVEARGDDLGALDAQLHEQYWDFETGHGWLWWIPDFGESMDETRRLASLRWRPEVARDGRLAQEYVLRFQRHSIDWSTRYYPNGAFDGYYPAGMWEDLDTHADDLFARAQLQWNLGDRAEALFGVEADRFLYDGDHEHDATVDVDDAAGGYPPFPNGATMPLGPWLDPLLDHPIDSLGGYGQLTARKRSGLPIELTLGARWDHTKVDYDAIAEPGRPQRSRTFDEVSPRAAVVFLPGDTVAVKLMTGRAFRAPTPTELAGAHTFSLASNIEQLDPERVTTTEVETEWRATRRLTLRADLFHTRFENQIAYSAANFNLSTNLFTTETSGLETELLYARGRFSGFANGTFDRRDDEEVIDVTIAPSPDRVAWAPARVANLGASWRAADYSAALVVHWQGPVERRASEVGVQTLPLSTAVLDLDLYRPRDVASWTSVDARVAHALPHGFEIALEARNLLDRDRELVKVLAFPFDYRQETRRWLVSLRLDV